ncbi:PREDICTED: mevalonate kinase-like [Trachymyrmex septentrionalis]|uniref:mevalonate kinase-like n=1 Tax=Trachymyrmex septentrionalis TaxID=34720 RepID=UPI00084F7142|nr:PREDICTED: mevalonate kinase-like [Trachymyrmex septentrionalis]
MYKFSLSTPGTMLLCEEHNNSCVAAALDMRTVVTFSSFLPADGRNFIEINFSSIQLHVKIPLNQYYKSFSKENDVKIPLKQYIKSLSKNRGFVFLPAILHEKVKNFITSMTDYDGIYEPNNQAHKLSLEAFFFLLASISIQKEIIIKSSFIVELSSKLPIGEGLGSSSSFVVCLTACFLRWYLLEKRKFRDTFKSKDLQHIMKYANDCEKFVYNSSNIIDIVISTYGMIKVFEEKSQIYNFFDISSMKILLVSSNVSHKTMEMKVKEHLPCFIDFVLNSMETISKTFIRTLRRIDEKTYSLKQMGIVEINSIHLINYYKKLMDLIHINQGLLRALGTSHPNLDIICTIARDFSLGGKIATRSGGKYAFILLLPNSSDELIQDLIKIFESHNFPAKIVSVNCSGVRFE